MEVALDARRSGAMKVARALGLDALHEPNFRWLIGGQWASLIGDYMVLAALPFAVFAVGGSTAQVGIAFGVDAMALLLLVLFGGVVGDRVSRRSIMIAADLARFGGEAIFAVLLLSGHAQFWTLLAVQAIHGAGSAFFLPAISGLLPETVREERLQEANALRGLCASSAAMIGPAIAGIALATAGVGGVFAIDAASFLLSAALLSMMRLRSRPSVEASIIADLAEGWSEFRRRTWLWAVVVEFALLNALVFAPFYVFGASVAEHSLGGAGAWTAILTACGIGQLFGGVLALSWKPRQPLFAATMAIATWALPVLLLSALAPVGMIVPFAALAGGGLAVFTAIWQTTLQSNVPSEQLSRLSAYEWVGSLALLPVGYMLAGFIAAAVGLRGGLMLAGIVVLVATVAVASVPSVRELSAPGTRRKPVLVPAVSQPER
jgi:MFS family permease